jgi:hypothetical protein
MVFLCPLFLTLPLAALKGMADGGLPGSRWLSVLCRSTPRVMIVLYALQGGEDATSGIGYIQVFPQVRKIASTEDPA